MVRPRPGGPDCLSHSSEAPRCVVICFPPCLRFGWLGWAGCSPRLVCASPRARGSLLFAVTDFVLDFWGNSSFWIGGQQDDYARAAGNYLAE